ncbi:MAG: glycosyltransferase [Verrucomicrobia bacterium]|nr:glycosyltransferase [Verrucomicrobiota bacterium]
MPRHPKSKPPSVLLVLPVHNEVSDVARIGSAIRAFLAKNRDTSVKVVDDGSDDGTADAFRRALRGIKNASVMALPQNGGKGRAVRLGLIGGRQDLWIFMDGDLAYDLSHVSPMVKALRHHDLVIGSRSMAPQPEGGLPSRRAFLGWGFNRLACYWLGFSFPDTQAGLKGFRRSVGQKLFSSQKLDDFAFDAELLYLARKMGFNVGQIPAQVCGLHTYKTSQVKLTLDTLRCLLDFLRIRFWSWTGQYRHL